MSGREAFAVPEIRMEQQIDERALRILTDGQRHSPQVLSWALARNPYMASFSQSELALSHYEVHRV